MAPALTASMATLGFSPAPCGGLGQSPMALPVCRHMYAGTAARAPARRIQPAARACAPPSPPADGRTAPLTPGTWDGSAMDPETLIRAVKLDAAGLVPAVAQQYDTGEVLMVAWMSAESIAETLRGGRAVYYSRSRKALWRKGDTSGQVQVLCDVLLDCDGDTLVLKVDQKGVACHTGRRTCFYSAYRPPAGGRTEIHDVLMDPEELYSQG
jgi:phosphoribosyl-AMP cyclohydrolase